MADSQRHIRRRERIITNMLSKYGLESVELFFKELRDTGKSSADSARRMGVTRSRASEWARVLGRRTTLYQVHPDVEAMAEGG